MNKDTKHVTTKKESMRHKTAEEMRQKSYEIENN